MSMEMGLAAAAPVEVLEAEGQDEMQKLLDQLRVEPQESEEVEAKFKLFEAYLETVEKMRTETFVFWDECREDFHRSGQVEIEKGIKRIDSQDNMGVEFHEGRWFVFDMTKKAGSNCGMIGRVLANIKSKIELLAQQDDCPICLEKLEECEGEPAVLGCCHKVCGECWEQWQAMERCGGHAVCPLCRHEEFLGGLFQRVEELPVAVEAAQGGAPAPGGLLGGLAATRLGLAAAPP